MQPQGQVPNPFGFGGPPNESLFHQFEGHGALYISQDAAQQQITQLVDNLSNESGERAIVTVCALVIENAVDSLLLAIMPGYGDLQDDRDFTLSMKIATARALRLIPSHILACADFIRKVRNDFAHSLELTSFAQMSAERRQVARSWVHQLHTTMPVPDADRDVFRVLSGLVAMALFGYSRHVVLLREFVGSGFGREAMRLFAHIEHGAD